MWFCKEAGKNLTCGNILYLIIKDMLKFLYFPWPRNKTPIFSQQLKGYTMSMQRCNYPVCTFFLMRIKVYAWPEWIIKNHIQFSWSFTEVFQKDTEHTIISQFWQHAEYGCFIVWTSFGLLQKWLSKWITFELEFSHWLCLERPK